MAPDGIVEPVDVAASNQWPGRLLGGCKDGPPDELGFQGLEKPLHQSVVVAIPLPDIEIRMPWQRGPKGLITHGNKGTSAVDEPHLQTV